MRSKHDVGSKVRLALKVVVDVGRKGTHQDVGGGMQISIIDEKL